MKKNGFDRSVTEKAARGYIIRAALMYQQAGQTFEQFLEVVKDVWDRPMQRLSEELNERKEGIE